MKPHKHSQGAESYSEFSATPFNPEHSQGIRERSPSLGQGAAQNRDLSDIPQPSTLSLLSNVLVLTHA